MRIPVTLLTGFLGSGKTTVLAHGLSQPAMADTAVIVNEFGAISIDTLIVSRVTENVIELRNGCLCCTIRGDLALTLRDLYTQRTLGDIPAFGQVVVETTGLADPLPLAHTLMANPALIRPFYLDTVVTVADATGIESLLGRHAMVANQLALADIVVLSKTDIASRQAIQGATEAINSVNPHAHLISVVNGAAECGTIFARGLFEARDRGQEFARWLGTDATHSHQKEYATHCIVRAERLSLAGTSVFLNRVVNELRGSVMRIKGIAEFVEKPGHPGIVHAVGDKFYPLQWLDGWPDEDRTSRFVFIGRELDSAWIDERFDALCMNES